MDNTIRDLLVNIVAGIVTTVIIWLTLWQVRRTSASRKQARESKASRTQRLAQSSTYRIEYMLDNLLSGLLYSVGAITNGIWYVALSGHVLNDLFFIVLIFSAIVTICFTILAMWTFVNARREIATAISLIPTAELDGDLPKGSTKSRV